MEEKRTGAVRTRWNRLCQNTHVCSECCALLFLLVAFGLATVGLHIGPLALVLMAILISGSDIYEWWKERH
ncbi:hypothetical protein VVD49_04375 [Uliginosibacterium sp. H3]|uniref:Uncharacterized protein n=1 Tax=Uliginosibacterium silvisoli TaxID=3114758 RepID=A0ABU6K043_9RHOO|nr:hypothetical protein [Uliginosibacterium sp. H3]